MTRMAAVPMPGSPARRSRLRLSTREALTGYCFILPWVIGFLVFMAFPLGSVFYLSLTQYDVLRPPVWTGLDNYRDIFVRDDLFLTSIANTLYYVVVGVPLRLVLALAMAVLFNVQVRGIRFFRALCYLPVLVPAVASSFAWMWILQPGIGVLKYVLQSVGLPSPLWYTSEAWSKPTLILMSLWTVALPALIQLARMQDIPRECYDAADIDGANGWHKFFRITLPLLTSAIFFNLVMGMIVSFQIFTPSYLVTAGGPSNSTLFYVLLVYQNAFRYQRMGYAAALSVLLFAGVLLLTLLVFRSERRWVFYEAE